MKKYLYLFFIFLFFNFFSPVVSANDIIAPVSTLSADPNAPNGENGWFNVYPTISIEATDDSSGVESIYYKINSDTWIKKDYTNYLNLVRNPSFEVGYISDWLFSGGFASVGYKSSLNKHSGNYSSGIISLNYSGRNFWQTSKYISEVPLTTYYYSFYVASVTSFLDNGFYEIVSVASNGVETILKSEYNLDLKLNYKNITGSFTTSSSNNKSIIIRVGIYGLGHLSIDDVSISKSPPNDSTEFILNREGINTVSFYSVDTAGNIENTKVATIKVDTIPPTLYNFKTSNQENIHKFVSVIDVQDVTSGMYSDETLFNYSVNGFDSGYYSNYSNCSGDFNLDLYLNISNDLISGENSGTLTTPLIDYCDANFLICKELKFFVKDLAGNVASKSVCVNGPFITTTKGNIFARESILSMGQGSESNLTGIGISGGYVSDIVSSINSIIFNYTNHSYLNNLYLYYYKYLNKDINFTTHIPVTSGIYYIQGNYATSNTLNYNGVDQIVFIDGNLTINHNISAQNSSVFYIVNGDVVISNVVTQISAIVSATNEISTSENSDLGVKITIDGAIIGSSINFNRNTDKTLGASEIINFPLNYFFSSSRMKLPVIYRTEKLN